MGGSPSGGGGTSTTVQKAEIPPELKPLYSQSAYGMQQMQSLMWPELFTGYTYQPTYGSRKAQTAPATYAQPTTVQPTYTPATSPYAYKDNITGYQWSGPAMPSSLGSGAQQITPEMYATLSPENQGYYTPVYGGGGGAAAGAATAQPTAVTPSFPEGSFLSPNPQQVAGMDPLTALALTQIPGLWNVPEAYTNALDMALRVPGVAAQYPEFTALDLPTSLSPEQYATLTQSPGYLATKEAFEMGVTPTIEQQQALMGLGTSTSLNDALALGWSQMAPGAVESEFGRMERGLEREMALSQWNELQRLGLEERAITREAEMMASMVPQLAGLGAQETERQLQAINASLQGGEVARTIEQAQYDAVYADFLRRQALAEQALFLPFGSMVPSSIGSKSTTTSTQSGGGGGLFK